MVTCKDSIKGLSPYVAGKPIDEVKRDYGLSHVIKLASNENPYGASKLAQNAMMQEISHINLYPDGYAYDLREKLSNFYGIAPDQLVFGTGSDGLIELICKTFCAPGDECVIPSPSFSLYETNTLAAGAAPIVIGLDDRFRMNLPEMAKAINQQTKVVWLCNPNNPTGEMVSQNAFKDFVNQVPDSVLVVVDEAYYEYARVNPEYPDSLKLLPEHKNMIILRTFSKIYGLAGLRVGYGIAHESLIKEMEKVRAPFNLNSIAQSAAAASLDDAAFVTETLQKNEENKRFLYQEFTRMKLTYIPSHTNFIMVNVKRSAKDVFEKLLQCGYIVKGGHVLGMPEYLRVTIGTKEECQGFVRSLAKVLEEA